MMNINKKLIVVLIIFLLIVHSIVFYIVLDKLEFFDQKTEPIIEKEEIPSEIIDPTKIKVTELLKQLDESMIKSHVEKICSFGPRHTAHRIPYKISNMPVVGKFFDLPIEKASKYIFNELESYGLTVRYQYWEEKPTIKNLISPRWASGWQVGNNIEATLPGTDKSSDEIYVLVAHIDSARKSPGANDDGTGIAALLTAAKIMSQYSFNHTVRFVFVSGEEEGLMGSKAYAKDAANNNDNIVATLNSEFLGTQAPFYRSKEALVAGYTQSTWIFDFIKNVSKSYPEILNFTIFWEDTSIANLYGHGSDYMSFLEYGYDAVVFAASTDPLTLNARTDTIENTDIKCATDISRLILATIAELAWDVEYN